MMNRRGRQWLIYQGWCAVVSGSIMIWLSLREELAPFGIVIGIIAILIGLLLLGVWYQIWKSNKDACSKDWTEFYF